jgi:hypothetical protein
MNKLPAIAFLLISAISGSISGCATSSTYQNTPTSKLCIDYLTLPSVNVNHGARAEELARRGENCNGYGGAAELRLRADSALQSSLNKLSQPSSNSPPIYQQGTHTYTINGRMMTCTTTGNVTNCL